MSDLDRVRVGVIGYGRRAPAIIRSLLFMDDVDVVAVCDLVEDRCNNAAKQIFDAKGFLPDKYSDYRDIIDRKDIDAVIACTSWLTHIQIAIDSMNAGKYVAIEVGGAYSINQCWQLVHTYERTRVPCMLLENVCYGRNELALLNMVKKGIFGELVHMEGGYSHYIGDAMVIRIPDNYYRHPNYLHRNCDNYPTHGLGPSYYMLNINRGNRLLSLVSVSSKSVGMHEDSVRLLGADSEAAKWHWQCGDVITTIIKTSHGETITLTLDTVLPRPKSRKNYVQGTKGIYMDDGKQIYIEGMSPESHTWDSFEPYLQKYEHPLWKWYLEAGVRGGHSGIDYLTERAFIESVKNRTQTPIDVYDTATMMSITVMSEESIAKGSEMVVIPDFTSGYWMERKPMVQSRFSLDGIYPELF